MLGRNEIVALINTAHRISESIRAVETFRKLYHDTMSSASSEHADHTSARQERELPPISYVQKTWNVFESAMAGIYELFATDDWAEAEL